MKKRSTKTIVLISAACILAAVAHAATHALTRDYVIAVNGSPVLEEEFRMLLAENAQRYESELRAAHQIPAEQSAEAFLGTETYREQVAQHNIQHVTALRVEQELAQEYGIAAEFTYETFIKELDAENQRRADKIAKGEAVYGLQSFSPEQYYSYYMSNLRQELIRTLPEALLTVTDADIIAYYEGLTSYAHLDGETIYYTLYDVTAAAELPYEAQEKLYGEVRATLAKKAYAEISAAGVVYRPQKCAFTAAELRDFIKQSFDAEFLLSLAVDEVSEAFTLGGNDYIAQYNGFDKAETLADNEKGVFKSQLREEAYQRLIAQRATQADIKVNQDALKRYIEEEEK